MDNLKNIRAYSKRQFDELDFDNKEYSLNTVEGEYLGVIDCKCWGKHCNLVTYFTLQDGRKIVASSWFENNYLGLANMPIGSNVVLTFKKAKTGTVYLREAKLFAKE